jgi:DNA repair exonuclease SbcCD ATPase subunit
MAEKQSVKYFTNHKHTIIMVTDVKLINYKIHRDFQFSPNGKSFAIVGDSGTGKSTLIDVILMSLGVIPFDKKCLSDGAESGRMEVTHDFGDGNKYTVKRRFSKKGVMRFEVTDQNGGDHTMEVLLGKVLGKAFTNTYFDYRKYFHDCKTSAARFEYMVRAVGGDVVLDNNRTINRKIDERNTIGGKRSTFETLLEQNTILDPDKLDEQEVYYAKLKTLDDIYEDETYKQLESQLIQKESLELDLEIVSESNDKYKKAELREVAIDTEIAELERQIRELKAEKKDSQKWRKQNPADFEFEKELAEQIAKADEQNAELYPKIKQAKDAAQERINTYNYEYNQFNTGLGYLQEFLSLNEKWNTINDSI